MPENDKPAQHRVEVFVDGTNNRNTVVKLDGEPLKCLTKFAFEVDVTGVPLVTFTLIPLHGYR